MKNNRHRIPRKNKLFHDFVSTTTATMAATDLPTVWERLGLTASEKDLWLSLGAAWKAIYTKCSSKVTCTATTIKERNTIKKNFIVFATPVLVRMSGSSALTEDDRAVFNLRKRDVVPTARFKIEGSPMGTLVPVGVATMRLRVRTATDSNRCSIHPLADGVEIRYALVDSSVALGSPEEPTTALQAPHYVISKRAIFLIPLEASASAKRLYVFMRWVNLSNPAHNGPWGTAIQSIVL